jgi:hypothetical protein
MKPEDRQPFAGGGTVGVGGNDEPDATERRTACGFVEYTKGSFPAADVSGGGGVGVDMTR